MLSFKQVSRDLKLLINSPIPFLYSYTYSAKKTVKIEPFSPDVKATGEQLVSQIKQAASQLIVHFVGSPVIEIPGQRDIDLYVECDPKDFATYVPIMTELFGQPQKSRDKFHEWHFAKNNCDVEIIFGDPKLPLFNDPLHVCEIIASNPEYIKEYARIKIESNGVSVREYKRRRLEFFNKILKENN